MASRHKLLLVIIAFVFAAAVSAQQAPKVKKAPAPYTSASSGKEMYQAYCASCHGAEGKGDGPAAAALKTPPTDLTQIAAKNGGKFPQSHVYEVIRGEANTPAHGSADMPVWGPVFRSLSGGHQAEVQLRINNLTDYIGGLQKK
jgi:mono/diheme cytochrome c family protein